MQLGEPCCRQPQCKMEQFYKSEYLRGLPSAAGTVWASQSQSRGPHRTRALCGKAGGSTGEQPQAPLTFTCQWPNQNSSNPPPQQILHPSSCGTLWQPDPRFCSSAFSKEPWVRWLPACIWLTRYEGFVTLFRVLGLGKYISNLPGRLFKSSKDTVLGEMNALDKTHWTESEFQKISGSGKNEPKGRKTTFQRSMLRLALRLKKQLVWSFGLFINQYETLVWYGCQKQISKLNFRIHYRKYSIMNKVVETQENR